MKIDEKKLEKYVNKVLERKLNERPIPKAPTAQSDDEEKEPPAEAPIEEPPAEEPAPEPSGDPEAPAEEPSGGNDPQRVEKIMNIIQKSPAGQQIGLLRTNREKIKAILKFSGLVGIPRNQLVNLFAQMKSQDK